MSWIWLYFLDTLAIFSFVISYYLRCYRRGYRIDIWHSQLFLTCVLPDMLMLPFARSEMNGLVLGSDLAAVTAALPIVFLITLCGYFAILTGGGVWHFGLGVGARRAASRLLNVVPQCSMMLMSSRNLLVFHSSLCLVLQFSILAIYFSHNGFAFDLRAYTFANPTLRPIASTIASYSVIIASHCLARYVDRKERILLSCTLLLTFGLVFFGARSNLLSIYINVLLCYLIQRRDRVSLIRMAGLIVVIISVGFYLGSARAGQFSLADFFGAFAFLLLYGNNFSDLRDFAWVYSCWSHVFWMGKTYLAALTAFVPRFASHFRDTWGVGVATASTIGFDTQTHPGVRPSVFGEGFFNFGWLGVIAVGFSIGIILRRIDMDVKCALSTPRPSMMRAFASTMLISVVGAIAISANSSALYVIAGVYLFSWFCLGVLKIVQLQ